MDISLCLSPSLIHILPQPLGQAPAIPTSDSAWAVVAVPARSFDRAPAALPATPSPTRSHPRRCHTTWPWHDGSQAQLREAEVSH